MPAKPTTAGEKIAYDYSYQFIGPDEQSGLAAAIDAALKDERERMVTLARGCVDYGGGYRNVDEHLAIYHHGIQTVVNVLESFCKHGFSDTQVAAVYSVGAAIRSESESG
jgi:hypothetical protein